MKQGSSRYGNDFESKSREFLAKYGYFTLAENEIIDCKNKLHKKYSHEIDIIAVSSGDQKAPNPPAYGPEETERFIVSCKGGLLIGTPQIRELENQIDCIQKDQRHSDI